MLKNWGFTLVEMMIGLVLSSSAVLATTSLLSSTTTSLFKLEQVSRLQNELNIIASVVYNDIQNAEFDALALERVSNPNLDTSLFQSSLFISQFVGEVQNSCITFTTDLNRDGQLTTQSPNERRGYRLREGALEVRNGLNQCNDIGWQDLTSAQAVVVDSFIIERHFNASRLFHFPFLRITILASLKSSPSINRTLTLDIPVNNVSI